MNNNHALWVEKYRPTSVDEYIFHDSQHRTAFLKFIADKTIPHLLLCGVQGSGKTTISQILIKEMDLDPTDVLTINASDDRGIDVFRDTIKNFASTIAFGGEFKIVHLEEACQITPTAQAALKRFMEEMSDHVRFILTANNINKIIPPIRSRCQEFHFKSCDKNDVAEYLITILASEKIKFNLDTVDKYVTLGHPDVRKVVNLVQANCVNNQLVEPTSEANIGDYRFKLIDLIEQGNWHEARKLVCASITIEEWESVYRFLYENLHISGSFKQPEKWEEGMIVLAEHLYKHTIVSDPEINFAAMMIRLQQIQG